MTPDGSALRSESTLESAAIVDAEDYFRAFYNAALRAEKYILIVGWQLDLDTELLRGREAGRGPYPDRFGAFLRALCLRRPDLQIYVLSWDYSVVYLLERQWWVSAWAKLQGHPHLRIEWRAHPDVSGSHHQKFVVIDGRLAFAGGIDFAAARWDRRRHAVDEPHRHNSLGLSSPPYHDIQAAVTGPAVAAFVQIFREAWLSHVGQSLALELPEPGGDGWSLHEVIDSPALPLPAGPVEISVTLPPSESAPPATGVCNTYARLIASAQHLIYVETQYFTSRIVCDALLARMRDRSKPSLALVMLLPDGAESGKERLVLGDQQQRQLGILRETASELGHQVRVLCSSVSTDAGGFVTTYIHSKIMIVDDRAVTIGSANLTNRSMGFDSELNLTWVTAAADAADAGLIRALRTSLLAEHAAVADCEQFNDPSRLVERIDALVADEGSKLRLAPTWEVDAAEEPVLAAVFDPGVEPGPASSPSKRPPHGLRSSRPVRGLWQRVWRVIRHPRLRRAPSGRRQSDA